MYFTHCCDLTFRVDSGQIPNLEHLHTIEVLMHVNATIGGKRKFFIHVSRGDFWSAAILRKAVLP